MCTAPGVNVNVNVNSIGKKRAWPNGADRTESSDDFAGRFQWAISVAVWRLYMESSHHSRALEPRFGKIAHANATRVASTPLTQLFAHPAGARMTSFLIPSQGKQ